MFKLIQIKIGRPRRHNLNSAKPDRIVRALGDERIVKSCLASAAGSNAQSPLFHRNSMLG
jgi:hypothetical protein